MLYGWHAVMENLMQMRGTGNKLYYEEYAVWVQCSKNFLFVQSMEEDWRFVCENAMEYIVPSEQWYNNLVKDTSRGYMGGDGRIGRAFEETLHRKES